jgi:hypothetical protein
MAAPAAFRLEDRFLAATEEQAVEVASISAAVTLAAVLLAATAQSSPAAEKS